MTKARVVALGDSCLAIQFDKVIDPAVNARCVALAESLARLGLRGVRDIVPTYNTVALHFDPVQADRRRLHHEIDNAVSALSDDHAQAPRTIEIPVTYGGADGPDLGAVAAFGRCSEADVVRLHTAPSYRVYMLGFLPGFPYMGAVDSRIAAPRLDTPRVRVAAGSVGIAGFQTGIYPFDTPGGWRIIGRTSTKVFDVARDDPFLLKAGDAVKFVAA
jgi:KipI family sensor histidine kinase inhibitor